MIDYYEPVARHEMEKNEEWHKWCKEIPALSFQNDWNVTVIPPFGGAIVRFVVSSKESGGRVSVYLDCFDRLGCCGAPYWEIYPYDDDVARYEMADAQGLISGIASSLEQQKGKRVNTND